MELILKTPVFIVGKSGWYEIYKDGKRIFCKCISWSSTYGWDKKGPSFYLDEIKKTPFPVDKELIAEQIRDIIGKKKL